MPFLLTFCQGPRQNAVGVFSSEENAAAFLACIPFARKTPAGSVFFRYAEMPALFVVRSHGWQYPLCRCSYLPDEQDGEIDAVVTPLSPLDAPCPAGSWAAGSTRVDAYVYDNADAAAAVEQRERFFAEAQACYEAQGCTVSREGLGSEDGEYVLLKKPGSKEPVFAFSLDPDSVNEWMRAGSFAAWAQQAGV